MAQSDYQDLVKRHEAVASLVRRAAADIIEAERMMTRVTTSAARKLDLELASKRRFLGMLEARLAVLSAEVAGHEHDQQALLAQLAGKSLS